MKPVPPPRSPFLVSFKVGDTQIEADLTALAVLMGCLLFASGLLTVHTWSELDSGDRFVCRRSAVCSARHAGHELPSHISQVSWFDDQGVVRTGRARKVEMRHLSGRYSSDDLLLGKHSKYLRERGRHRGY